MEIKERIIKKSKELFFRYGVKSVTMDDIAHDLGISKKTIYQNFNDKDEIVYQVMLMELEDDKCQYMHLSEVTKNVIEKLIKMSDLLRLHIANMNPCTVFDIKRYYPRSWDLFRKHKKDFILEQITNELREGIAEGLIRSEINLDVLALLRLEQVELAFNDEIFPPEKFNILDIQLEFLDHFTRGVMTEEGLKIYNQYKNQQKHDK
ncbi:DNA-binding transcriptional regulator, AcrR family [Pseudarcicella hirudinis]|uniref:DNA-binding transcriptional regulator, AcrR family n=1 Tax=Pseudarcicella hirudinis TaxID=1079859 RepID=A0A1I5XKF8_9BACT|nr:TetR/AcrR family transcriptional regulator [Pseudarcicella hirudinis]SFQ32462.1 DNA-binding transcriptional regulator, AcrR family [Pseudarcicella hirudinis]